MCKAVVNEDANTRLIRELKTEVDRLRELLRIEGTEIGDGKLVLLQFANICGACTEQSYSYSKQLLETRIIPTLYIIYFESDSGL